MPSIKKQEAVRGTEKTAIRAKRAPAKRVTKSARSSSRSKPDITEGDSKPKRTPGVAKTAAGPKATKVRPNKTAERAVPSSPIQRKTRGVLPTLSSPETAKLLTRQTPKKALSIPPTSSTTTRYKPINPTMAVAAAGAVAGTATGFANLAAPHVMRGVKGGGVANASSNFFNGFTKALHKHRGVSAAIGAGTMTIVGHGVLGAAVVAASPVIAGAAAVGGVAYGAVKLVNFLRNK